MPPETCPRPQTLSSAERSELVLRIVRGELSPTEAAREKGLPVAQVLGWRERFLSGAREALEAPRAPSPSLSRLRVHDSIEDAVGNTPLIRLGRVMDDFAGEVFAKIEYMNPMGSIKDRVARHMVRVAAADGRLNPGEVIVESSSGNTALGLGMMAIRDGYHCKVVVRDSTSREKIDALLAMGVEVQLVDSTLPPEHPESYNRIMDRVVAETPDSYFPDQHGNRENNEAHYLTTGPEIWEQMDGRIDVLVAGLGTGGTICGVARYLKERDPSIRVVGVDPVGSVFSPYFNTGQVPPSGPYALEGLGDEFLINTVEFELIDEMLQVTDGAAFRAARELARREAILAGGSSGAALWAAREVAKRIDGPARIVTVFPDGGARYLSTIYNDSWMRERGYLG
jgi:cystathionine beta-synthase